MMLLFESFKDGDCVVFFILEQVRFFEWLIKDVGLNIEIMVVLFGDLMWVFGMCGILKGCFIFDYVWFEEFYMFVVNNVLVFIDKIQCEGFGIGEVYCEIR